jgi:hypothetical protein
MAEHDGKQMPSWIYLGAMMLGLPVIGGGGAYLGNTQATQDIAQLQEQVDALDDKIDALLIGFVRAHPDVAVDKP